MPSMSRSERAALCNTALETGEDADTLCEGWSVKDLVIHLLVRERDPLAAAGIAITPLAGFTERASARLADADFSTLVERVRSGPPRWSPTSIGRVDRIANTLEFFVHHEDIRRAQPGWAPRELSDRDQEVLWRSLAGAGKGLLRSVDVPVEIRWAGDPQGRTAVLRAGEDPVVLSGPPAELTVFLFGRDQTSGLSFDGPADAVNRLREAPRGF